MTIKKLTTIITFFNPFNKEHIAAYYILLETGKWPEWFLENAKKALVFEESYYLSLSKIISKMAGAWLISVMDDKILGMPPWVDCYQERIEGKL